MLKRFALLGVALAVLTFAAPAARSSLQPAAVHADNNAWAAFTPQAGGALTGRLFSFTGFWAGEVIDLTFTTPDGATASVGDGSVFTASAQDDGTGQFSFTPSDWLSPLVSGQWTVTAKGESSGYQATTTLVIYGSDSY